MNRFDSSKWKLLGVGLAGALGAALVVGYWLKSGEPRGTARRASEGTAATRGAHGRYRRPRRPQPVDPATGMPIASADGDGGAVASNADDVTSIVATTGFASSGDHFIAHPSGHDLSARVEADGRVVLASATGHHPVTIASAAFGRGRRVAAVSAASLRERGCDADGIGEDGEKCSPSVDVDRTAFVETWREDAAGIHHEIRVVTPAEGQGLLRLELAVDGASVSVDGDRSSATFAREGAPALRYAGLLVRDAAGHTLASHLQATERGVAIEADDRFAQYPIVIDPIVTAVPWTNEPNQATAHFGASVTAIGDVNGDGLTDVAVGAPDFDNGQTDEGRVTVYYGTTGGGGLSASASWTAESDQSGAHFGAAVSSAGDVNGDGYGDLAVGAPDWNGGLAGEGRVFVYLGSASGLGAAAAWFTEGEQANAHYGKALAFGDVSNDGYSELVIGAPDYDNPEVDEGRVFLFAGSASGLSGTASGVAEVNQAGASFGTSVAIGDFNGAGAGSLVVGAPNYDAGETDEGRAYRFDVSGAGVITGAPGWTVEANQANAHFGAAVAVIGANRSSDNATVAVGAPQYDNGETDEGRVYLYAASGSELSTTAYRTEEVNQAGAEYGASVAFAGDINGDAFGDWVVGAPGYDNGQTDEGRMYVYQGAAADAFTGPFTFESDQANARLGVSVSSAGDVDGNGLSDIVVGASQYDNGETDEGLARLYFGSVQLVLTPRATVKPATPDSGGFAVFGNAVKSAGDVNGDGFADVMVHTDPSDTRGTVSIYFGSASGPSTTVSQTISAPGANQIYITMSPLGDVNGDGYDDIAAGSSGGTWIFHGSASGLSATPATTITASVMACTGAGDVNGDGYADMIISNGMASTNIGSASVYYGSATGLSTTASWTVAGSVAGAYFGWMAGSAGDVDGDGFGDVVVFSPYFANGQASEGRLQVYLGSATGLATTAAFTAESDCAMAYMGDTGTYMGPVFAAADVDGNGRSDLVVGTGCGGGRMYIYRSGPTGLLDGFSVSTINATHIGKFLDSGDFNGDGYYDVVTSGSGAGGPNLYFGASSGLGTTPTPLSGIGGGSETGLPVGSAGDTNGDGADDVVTRAFGTPSGGFAASEGASFYMGGDSAADPTGLRLGSVALRQPGGATPLARGARSTSSRSADLRWLNPSTPTGRTRTRLQLDGKITSALPAFGVPYRTVGAFAASDVASLTGSADAVTAPVENTAYRWRIRQLYSPSSQVAVPASRWRSLATRNWPTFRTATCGTGRTNSAGGSCDACLANYYGANCDFCQAATTCNTHGTCSASGGGACTCSAGWAAPTCATCQAGFVGGNCQYSDATTCNGHGTAQADGSCVCATGFSGARCDACAANYYNFPTCTFCQASSTCSAHGTCSATGSCTCTTGFQGASCNACAPGYFNYPTCAACDPMITCNSHGTCSGTGTCNCSAGFAGANCQYSDAVTCNGRGTAQSNGSCVCGANFAGPTCASCAAGRAGSNCQYSDAVTCNGHGTAQTDGSCICSGGFVGGNCQYSNATTCNSHGTAQSDGSCVCTTGFSGAGCNACAANYYAYPTCTFCVASSTCNSNGTCSATGSCTCNAGAAGAACQYTDATTCSGHGTAQSNGSCVCAANFTGASCASCVAGRAGPLCQYSDAVTCNAHGTAQSDGSCVCSMGFTGAHCEFSASATCNNHGAAQMDGSCICGAGYSGATCNACATDYYSYPTCTFCQASTTCNAHGTCSATGTCTCNAGAAGATCQYTDATTCNGHGTAQSNGSCVCATNFTGATCATCVAGRAGPLCQYSDATTCNGHGTAQSDGSCVCTGGFVGAGCQYSDATTCSGHGTAQASGACTCNAGFGGASCNACATNYYAYPTCTFCQASTTCNGNGTCSATGTCSCNAGAVGAACQYSNATTCNGHGTAQSNGSCVCATGFTGAACDQCSVGYAGYPSCAVCDRAGTCNNHGSCTPSGCSCDASYAGASCDRCAPGFVGYPSCLACDASITCRGHGVCAPGGGCTCDAGYSGSSCQYSNATSCRGHGTASAGGACTCATGYSGMSCEACDTGYAGYPTCRACSPASCGTGGSCDGEGRCVCATGSFGEHCEYSRATTCSNHGTPSAAGRCTCDAGYAGPSCSYTRALCNNHGNPQDSGACLCDEGYSGATCTLSAADTCNDHGLVTSAGDCSCRPPYTGPRCQRCATDYYGYPACNFCTVAQCNFGGSCGGDGRCVCTSGRAGRYCEYSDAETCNNNGHASDSGGCFCAPGFAGARCQYSDARTCSGHGVAQSDGSCVCAAGYAGPHCEYGDVATCDGRGRAQNDGSCVCNTHVTGAHCESCETDYYGRACTFCQATATCSGHGTCAATGGCTCDAGWVGAACQYSDATTCNGHGTALANGKCTCATGWTGAQCTSCANDYYGTSCATYCNEATTCGGHGRCSSDGTCSCMRGYQGASCEACPPGYTCAGGTRTPIQCPAGRFGANGLTCVACSRGTWAPAGSGSCMACATSCDDFNPCTADVCLPTTGVCSNTATAGCTNCGNGMCEARFGETCSTCAADCGVCAVCGDGRCASDSTHEETCWNCAEDCSVCKRPRVPAVADGGMPIDGATMEDPDAGMLMCTGTPRFPGSARPFSIELVNVHAETPKIAGRQGRIEGFGTLDYSFEFEEDDNLCMWEAEAGIGIRACIDQDQGPGTVSQCTELGLTAGATCRREPECSLSGYTCSLGDWNTAYCRGTLSARVARTLEFSIRKDFGPFFAECSLGIGAEARVSVSEEWGRLSRCAPAHDTYGRVTLTGQAHATASVGVTVAGHDFSLSGGVKACVVGGLGVNTCARERYPIAGFKIEVSSPSLDLGVTEIGPYTRSWSGGNECDLP